MGTRREMEGDGGMGGLENRGKNRRERKGEMAEKRRKVRKREEKGGHIG